MTPEKSRATESRTEPASGHEPHTRYSHPINTTSEHEEHAGQSLATRSHEVIRQWAESRHATPCTAPGSEHDEHPGVLRFDFPGYGGGRLQPVPWEDWFRAFDERGLTFIFQEHTSDGKQSNFFRLVREG
jgi:hypothetical protein